MKKLIKRLTVFFLLTISIMMVKETTIQAKSIKINKKSFPCSDIRKYAKKNFDMNNDGKLSKKELKKAKKIADISVYSQKELECLQKLKYLREIDELRLKKVKSIQSLGKLKKLEKLVVVDYKKKLKKVSLKTFKSLKCFTLDAPIRKIELDKKGKLDKLSLTSAKIKKLDISNNRGLTELKITKTPVRTLKLNKSIKSLHLENVPVKQLKLSKKMKSLKLENVPLKELRINQSMEALNLDKVPVTNLFLNKKVKKVQLSDVPITKLEIPNDVEKLLLSAVKIRNLKLFNMKKLDDLWLTANGKLEMLIIENCEKLRKLHISSLFGLKQLKIKQLNGLDSLTFWDMPAIPFVEFNGIENISELELYASDSKGIPFYEMKKVKKVQFTPCPGQCIPKEILSMPGVVELDVIEETVTKVLDLDEMINLKILRWEEGVLENIKLTDKSKITYMLLNKNNLSGDWDMSEYTSLSDFSCSDNHISTINLGERNGLDGLSCVNNDLKRLDAYNAMDIYCLSATGNPSLEAFLPRKAYGDGYHSFDKTAKVHYNPASKPLYKYLYAG